MVKAYLRYNPTVSFGVVCSGSVALDDETENVLSASLEVVNIWNVRRGELVGTLRDLKNKSPVTALLLAPNGNLVAVGYHDGAVRIFDLKDRTCSMTLNGHKKRVTCLHFNETGTLLTSGSADTNIVVWDVVGEQGLFRLKGHRNEITDVYTIEKTRKIISCSKDTLVKIWDMDTRVCVSTIVGHREEIWSIHVSPNGTRLVTGSSGPRLRVWSLDPSEFHLIKGGSNVEDITPEEGEKADTEDEQIYAKYIGKVDRKSTERVSRLRFSADGDTLYVQTAGKQVEIFSVADEERRESRRKRRALRASSKKRAKAGKKAQKEEEAEAEEVPQETQAHFAATDELEMEQLYTAQGDLSSIATSKNQSKIVLGLSNNKIEVLKLKESEEDEEKKTYQIAQQLLLPGHRSEIRDVSITVDDTMVMTTSNTEIKIWNVASQQCIRTMQSGYGMCGGFLPGNKHVVIGTKQGFLELYEINSGECIQKIEAHTGCVWSLHVKPDKTGLVSGSADKDVKFWEFEILKTEHGKHLALKHTRTLKMSDDVLCVRYSPDCKYVAASLLDNTVKIFFEDSLKFYLSLYGHRLPVMTVDFSSDGTLVATGSAEKTSNYGEQILETVTSLYLLMMTASCLYVSSTRLITSSHVRKIRP